MRPAPFPVEEQARLAALRQTGILDTPPEEAFDQLTDLAAELCGAPVALITLVDVDRQWFKSHHGIDVVETSRDVAFCAYTILADDLFVVNDALEDERFADNPLVIEDPKIRFYAGSPLLTRDGHALGSFCVIDYQPRKLPAEHAAALRALARNAAAMLELRRTKGLLGEASLEWERATREGDLAAREASLEVLGVTLQELILERERAEASLHELVRELETIDIGERLRTVRGLVETLEPSCGMLVESSRTLLARMDPGDPLRKEAKLIHNAALRARSILTFARRAD